MGFFLAPVSATALRNYKYKGVDHSLLYRHVFSPLAEWLAVHCVPPWMAPNMVTLIGFAAPVTALLLHLACNPGLDDWRGHRWLHALTLACFFFYMNLDNVDGKHARRTGSSSPLGLLFDHGCDALNAGLSAITFCSVFGTGATVAIFLPIGISYVPFYVATWEHYYLGEFVLPVVNGPNEGMMFGFLFCFLSAYHGPQFFWDPNRGLFGNNWFTCICYFAAFCISSTIVPQAINAMRAAKRRNMSLVRPIIDLFPVVVWAACVILWVVSSPELLAKHPFALMMLFAFVFVEMLTHIMLCHVASMRIQPFARWPLLFLVIGVANKLVAQPEVGLLPEPPVDEYTLLWVLFYVCLISVSVWHYFMVQEVAKELDIYVFKLGKRSDAKKLN